MAKPSMKSRLARTVTAETASVQNRFEKADSLITDKPRLLEPSPQQAELVQEEKAPELPAPEKKLIRHTFSLPADDFELIALLQQRCLQSALSVTQGELVRAGLKVLYGFSDEQLIQAVESVEKLKRGSPHKKK
jgi:hypothetical protein